MSFARDGYEVVRDVVPREVVARTGAFLAGHVEAAQAQLCAAWNVEPGAPLVERIALELRDGGAHLPPDIRSIAMGHFPLEVRLAEQLWEVPLHPAVRALVEPLLDGEGALYLHLPPAARFVLPGNRFAGVPPHQDFRYNEHLPPFLTVWVPFVAIDDACGGVVVYEGPRERDLPLQAADGPWLGGLETTEYRPKHMILSPGDVLLLDNRVVHGSAPNVSDRTRISTDFRFFAKGRSRKHALDLATRTVIAPAESA